MQALAITGAPRRWIVQLHRWSGLVLLAFLLVASVTGALMAFRWEIDRAINPQLFHVTPTSQRLPLKGLVDLVQAQLPDAIVTTVVLPSRPEDAAILYVKSRMQAHVAHVHVVGMKGSLDFNQIFVNPYNGEVLGQRSTTRFIASWENFVPDVVRLHFALFLDETGAWIMGVSAVVWLLTTFVGVGLIWPRAWHSTRAWLMQIRLRRGSGSYKLHYDLHRSLGLVVLPVLLVVAFTSVYLNLPGLIKPVVKTLSPTTGTSSVPSVGPMEPAAPRVAAEVVMTAAQQAYPDARLHSVGMDYLKGLYSVRLQQPQDVSPTGNTTLFYNMRNGQKIFARTLADASAGDVFQAWMWPLHTGRAFGLVGQCLVFLAALSLVITCVTGYKVWQRKTWGARRTSSGQTVPTAPLALQRRPDATSGVKMLSASTYERNTP